MSTTTTSVQVTIAAGRMLAVFAAVEGAVDINAGVLGASAGTKRIGTTEIVFGPYSTAATVTVRSVGGGIVTYYDKLQYVPARAEVDPVTGVPSGNLRAGENGAITATSQLTMDSQGNPSGVTSTTGTMALRQIPGVMRVALAGDSISEQFNYATGVSVSIVSPGIARMVFSPALNAGAYWPGDEIKVTGAPDRTCNTMSSLVTAVDPSLLWVEYAVSAKDNGVITGTPTMYRKYATATMSYLAQACAQLGIHAVITVDASIGGGDSSQVNELLNRDWVESDVSFYAPGMNDLYARGFTFAQIKANDIANLKILRRAKKLIVVSVPPRYHTAAGWTSALFAEWRQVNEWRRQYAQQIGAQFVDFSSAELGGLTYADPTSTTADPRIAGTVQTSSDGVHPLGAGGAVAGACVAVALGDIPRNSYLPASASVNSTDGYVAGNPLLARTALTGTTSGTATFQNLAGAVGGEVADGCVVKAATGSATLLIKCGMVARSKAIHGDSLGNAQRVIVDNTAGATTVVVTFQTNDFHALMVDGDSIDYAAHVVLSDIATPGSGNPAGLMAIVVGFLEQHATSGNKFGAALAGDNGTGYMPGHTTAPYKRDKTRSVASAGAFTGAFVQVSATVAAGRSACVDVGRVLARRVINL